MKKVKIKNEFEGEKNKIETGQKKFTLSMSWKGWVNVIRKNHLKFTQKEKEINMAKFQMLLKKNNENVTKKPDKGANSDS